ncbi:NDP-sugar synthase [Nibricoccus sp. IMCC34717]|uniref:nucleotidyltransferase family protein n=1 Tax=Nibricoccus sp. IMCC34717 TaxID=3034021 RepID=UPI00384F39B8
MSTTLLILAAGMGSRFGGLKQLEPVGPSGETLLDYSVYDAVRAGFDRVVFVIRRDFEAEFKARICAKYERLLRVETVFQSLDALPPGTALPPDRTKPWGTGHATWCAREALNGPFAVLNADDFYGREAYAQLAQFIRTRKEGEAAIAGYTLRRTLSENGSVSRGVCRVSPDGWLESVTEHKGIAPEAVGVGRTYSGEEVVSMNCWAFGPEFLTGLDAAFRRFCASLGENAPTAEFYLPAAVSDLVGEGKLRVRVVPAESDWFGVTFREDKPKVVAALAELTRAGVYPSPLLPSP